MSIDISAKIKNRILTVDELTDLLHDYFNKTTNANAYRESRYKFTSFCENDDIVLYFIDYDNTTWDSIILNSEFLSAQNLIFDISKFSDLSRSFNVVFRFLIDLNKKHKCEMLITSSIHDEICCIGKDSNIAWLNSELKNVFCKNND